MTNTFKDRACSTILMGLTCCALANISTSVRTTIPIQAIEYPAIMNNQWTGSGGLRSYNRNRKTKFKAETEAQRLFGHMREASALEHKKIQESIDNISVPTGVGFWD